MHGADAHLKGCVRGLACRRLSVNRSFLRELHGRAAVPAWKSCYYLKIQCWPQSSRALCDVPISMHAVMLIALELR
jgi:hypothetical protein